MGIRQNQLFDIVIIQSLHSLDSFAAPVLTLEIIPGHTLDITKLRHGDYHFFLRDQIFHGNIKFIVSDGGSSWICIFIANLFQFLLNHAKKQILVSQNCF